MEMLETTTGRLGSILERTAEIRGKWTVDERVRRRLAARQRQKCLIDTIIAWSEIAMDTGAPRGRAKCNTQTPT